MQKTVRSVVLAGVLAGASVVAMADGASSEEHAERWAERFDISEAQQAELRQLREAYGPQLREQREQMHELRKSARALDPADEGYVASARELSEQRAGLRVEHDTLRAELRHQTAAVLTPEQREAMAEARKEHMERRGEHRKRKMFRHHRAPAEE